MARFRVLYTDRGDYSHDFSIEQPYYDAIGAEVIDARLDHNALDWPTYARHLAVADALICFRVSVDRRAVEAAPKLKVAVRSGVGYENFDLAAFAERGIPACNVPDYGSEEVSVGGWPTLTRPCARASGGAGPAVRACSGRLYRRSA